MNTVQTELNGRLPDGTFGPGNKAAAGHKRRQRMAMLRAAFVETVTPEAIQEIVETLVRQAKAGCPQSAKLVLDRACGKLNAMDSEDPAEPSSAADELGPVTAENLAEHKRRALAELGPITEANIEQHRAIRLARLTQN